MHAIRIPASLVAGAALSLGLFFTLSKLISARLNVGPVTAAPVIVFTPQRTPAPTSNKRDEKLTRTPPPMVPVPGGIGTGARGLPLAPTAYAPPVVDLGAAGRGPAVGADHDVLPLVRVPPEYPPRANVKGWVRVQFSVTATGSVRDAVVVASEPGTIFDDAALRAIARWRYNPRVENGEAVERVGLETVIRFELED